jgi:hypothetical protein
MAEINWNIHDVKKQPFQFKDLEVLKEFAKKESEFWKVQGEMLGNYKISSSPTYIKYYGIWESIYRHLKNLAEKPEAWNQAATDPQMGQQLRNWSEQLSGKWLWSGHPFIDPWIGSYKLSQATGDAFIAAMLTNKSQNTADFGSLRGYILAYEFQLQDESNLTERRYSEEEAFARLRDQLVEKRNEIIAESTKIKEDIAKWKTETQGQYESWFEEKRAESLSAKERQEQIFSKDQGSRRDEFSKQMDSWFSDIKELENTYKEKLKLAKPAEYWATRAKNLRTQGYWWTGALVVLLGGGMWLFADLFTKWLVGVDMALSLHSFQGVVLLTVIVSSFAFLVRIVSRLAFSAFHLQRDAEEREQLAYVYLALANETKPDEESKKIILQSLFSRAETGLLSGDSGPTMPISDAISAGHRINLK